MYCDKGKDDEILSELHNSKNTQPDWHGPNPIGMGQNKRSFKASARIPFTTFCSNLSSGLTRWIHSHAVKVPVTSTTKVSFSVDADAKTNNALSFRHTASSTLQLVVASITNEFSKGPTIDSPAKQRPVPKDDPAIESSLQPQVPMIIASIWQLIVVLTFEQSIEAFPIFQLIDVSVPNKNDSCSVFQMFVHGHNTFIKSTSFNDGSFQLIVELILILISEGAQFASATLQTFAEGDQAAPQNANLQTTNNF